MKVEKQVCETVSNLFKICIRNLEYFNLETRPYINVNPNAYPYDMIELTHEIFNGMLHLLAIISKIYENKLIVQLDNTVNRDISILMGQIFPIIENKNNIIYKIFKKPNIYIGQVLAEIINMLDIAWSDNLLKLLGPGTNDMIKVLWVNNIPSKLTKYIIKKLSSYVPDTIDYPSEFIDPISCDVITQPYLFPNISQVHDLTTILTQLSYGKFNPYTKDILDETILHAYNKTPGALDIINKYKLNYNQWVVKSGYNLKLFDL